MAEARLDLGLATYLKAEALGAPGQRRFRLLVQSPQGSACLWLEKEQLQALAQALAQLLAQHPSRGRSPEPLPQPIPSPGFSDPPTFEGQVFQMGLGYDREADQLVLLVYERTDPPSTTPAVSCRAAPPQARALSQEIWEVCAAGRPRCPLCGVPLDGPQHVCPGSNGHGVALL